MFPKQGGFVSFAAGTLPAHEYAFALTIHKSQGSEYPAVVRSTSSVDQVAC
jgi:exodeoxyribonuclease V alpha subunit